jgi:hypothetical protein
MSGHISAPSSSESLRDERKAAQNRPAIMRVSRQAACCGEFVKEMGHDKEQFETSCRARSARVES